MTHRYTLLENIQVTLKKQWGWRILEMKGFKLSSKRGQSRSFRVYSSCPMQPVLAGRVIVPLLRQSVLFKDALRRVSANGPPKRQSGKAKQV